MPRSSAAALAVLALSAALPVTAHATPGDPFEKFNRRSFAFSMRLDRYIVGPLANLSKGVIPAPVARLIHNVIVNLSEPQCIVNDVLQMRPERAVKDTTRLVVNSSIGLLGVIDVAAAGGIPHQANGFGDTLGRYGVKPGPYLFVPVLGPSDFRDLAGSGVDQVSSPMWWLNYPYKTPINLGLGLAGGLEQRAQAGPQLQALLSTAADPYATLRSTYLQARAAEIRGETALPPLPDIEGPSEAAPSTGTANPSPDQPPPPTPDVGSAPGTTPAPDVSPAPDISPAPSPAPPPPPSGPQTDAASGAPTPAPPPSPATP